MKHFITSILLLNCYLLHAQTQLGSDIDGEAAYSHFGNSVSIDSDGNRLAISIDGNDFNSGLYSGGDHVRVYEYNSGSWAQLGGDLGGDTIHVLNPENPYHIKWLNVGNFHSPYSGVLVNREEEPWGNAPLMWPAIDYHSGNSRAQGFWMGATNFTDENGTTFPHKIAHIGPRSLANTQFGGDVQFFAVEQSITSKFDPEITVDGVKSFEKYGYVDETDTEINSDRIMTVSNNSRIGITTEATMMAFSQEYHDDYHIIEYTFTNTGNVDGDEEIELNSGLTGVYFFFIHRYMVHDASSWIQGGGAPWGKFTMNDAVGDGHEDYDVDFRAQYAWAGLNPDNTSFSSIGGPMMFPHWASAGWDTTGRLAAGQMVGRVTIESPDTYGSGDTGSQPSTMGVMGSDDPNLTTDEYDASLMQIQYNIYMASGRLYPHHADYIEPSGNFDTPTNAPNIYDGVYDEGGWSVIEGHGPYDIPWGGTVDIVVADGVGGLSMKAKYDIGKLYKATGITPNESAMLSYNGSSMTKNQWALTAKDSLFKTFERALANHAAGYNIPQPPHPPEKFEVTSGTDKITLSWVAASGGPSVTGWHLYRAKATYNFPYIGGEAPLADHGGLGYELIADLGTSASSYEDASVELGENYYYFIQAVGDAAENNQTAMTPAGSLKSNQHWTQTYLPASIKRAPGERLGWSVSIDSDGDRVAIGAITYYSADDTINGGNVQIYEYGDGSWTQLGSNIYGEATGDWSGKSVSIDSDGGRVAIGAFNNDGTGTDAGHVRVYEYSNGNWSQLGSDIDGEAENDHSGYSVSIASDGDRVAIGAPSNSGNGTDAGHVRVYEYSNGNWSQLGSDIDGEAENDHSGYSVSIASDGNRVAIGAWGNDAEEELSNTGHVRVYEYSGGNWIQLGGDIDGESTGDFSSNSISIDSNGDRVAIGAASNSGNGINAGHVRVYEYGEGGWIQSGSDIDGESSDDNSGYSVSLGSDGVRLAIGAWGNDGTDVGAGHVRVYQLNALNTDQEELLPIQYALHQNYPNPFNPITTLRYDLAANGYVTIIIYDMLGRQVKTLINQSQDAGYKSIIWNATNNYSKPVSAGIYLYQIQAGEYMQTKKMVLLK